jgi:hypothetical protein
MTSRILDACTLINLHCGWNGVGELSNLGIHHFVGDVVSAELIYVRHIDEHGLIVQRKLTFEESRLEYPIPVLSMVSKVEQEMMIRFAAKIDDGEAEGLAIANARGFVFCSDDEPVRKLVQSEGLGVRLISTPEILQAWANGDQARAARLPDVVRRITTLARFRPHRASPHLAWWEQQLGS